MQLDYPNNLIRVGSSGYSDTNAFAGATNTVVQNLWDSASAIHFCNTPGLQLHLLALEIFHNVLNWNLGRHPCDLNIDLFPVRNVFLVGIN